MKMVDLQGAGLSLLSRMAQSDVIDTLKLRKPFEKILYRGSKAGFQVIGATARAFKSTDKKPRERLPAPARSDLFDLNLTDEQQMVRESVQRFAAELLYPAAHKADDSVSLPADLRTQAAELGLAYYAVPESMGGAANEQSVVTQMLAAEDLAHGDFSLAAAILAPISVANALTRWGTAEQQNRYLPAFASEQAPVASIAVNEATPLFNPQKLSTVAKRSANGYVLNGEKSLVLCGADAELLLVAAMLDDKPALFIVEGGSDGMSWMSDEAMGLKATGTMKLRLDNLALPADALLGDQEFNYQAFLDFGYLAWCALAVGTAQAVLDYVIPYCNDRVAFGEPISHRQGVAFMIADLAVEIDSMRMLTWNAASLAEAGKPFHREVYLARLLCAEKSMQIGTNGVQLLGGHGFTKEHPVERWYRDLRFVAIAHGGLHL